MEMLKRLKRHRVLTLFMAFSILLSMLIPTMGQAATQVKIETKTSQASPLKHFSSDGTWEDLTSPWHYIVENGGEGPVGYCLMHKMPGPHSGNSYEQFDPTQNFSQRTINGLQIILELGYPSVSNPFGTSDAWEAHCATSNAIRFWLSEETGGPNDISYGYTNLGGVDLDAAFESCQVQGKVRGDMNASSQREFRAAIRLLQAARSQQMPVHTISLSPGNLQLKTDGDYFSGNVHIGLEGIDSFAINMGLLPSGTVIVDESGNSVTSGSRSMDVTVKVPREGNAAKQLNFVVQGSVSGPAANMYWMTCGGEAQDILYWSNESLAQVEKSLKAETPKYGKIEIVKEDSETGSTPQGDAILTDAVFEIVADENVPDEGIAKGQVVQTLTLNGTTKATSRDLPQARYLIREKSAPEGYLTNTKAYDVTVIADQTTSVTVPDEVIKAPICIIKFLDEPQTGRPDNEQIKTPEAGAKFEIRLKSNDKVYDSMTTDKNGYAKSVPLPYGRYVIKQVAGTPGYKFVDPFEVEITEPRTDPIPYIIENTVLHNEVKIMKKDAESGELIAQAGVKFKVQDSDGNWVVQRMLYPKPVEIDVYETTADGTLTMPEPLRYGKYKLFEVEAPYMYLLNGEPVEFEISDPSVSKIVVEMKDTLVKGKVEIEKTGDMLVGIEEETLEDGIVVKHPVFEKRNLAGVEIEIVAAEDIVTPDKVTRAKKGDIVQTITTTADGKNVTEELYLGRYIVREKATVEGFLLDETEYEVNLEYADQNTPIIMEGVSLVNERSKVEVLLQKDKEVFGTDGKYTFAPGEGFTFGLIASEDFFGVDDKETPVILAGDIVSVSVTDAEGKGQFAGYVPYGQFVVKELSAASPDFELNEEEYPVDLTFQEGVPVIKVSINEGETVQNLLKKVPVQISKTDITGEKFLPGAKVEIYDSEGNKIYEGVTGEDGKTEELFLPVNTKFTYKETYAVPGYALNTQLYQFEVTLDGKIVGDMTIKDEVARIVVLKVDGKTNQPLAGVKLGLYNEKGELVAEQVSNESGLVVFEGVGFGKYQIRELETVENYQLSGETIDVSIDGTYENPVDPILLKNYPVVKTGVDDFPWWAIAALAGAASVALVIAYIVSKKRKK